MSSAPVVEAVSGLPVAQIIGSETFIGPALIDALAAHHLKIITAPSPLTGDYIFYFSASPADIHQFLASAPRSAKVLVASPLETDIDAAQLLASHANLRLVVLPPHLYGPGLDLNQAGILGGLLAQLRDHQPLRIVGDGLTPVYPTFIADVISGLTAAMFSSQTEDHQFVLINPQSISGLNLAYRLRSLAPGSQLIESVEGPAPKPINLPEDWLAGQEQLHWHPVTDLNFGLHQTLESLKSVPSAPSVLSVIMPSVITPRRFSSRLKFWLLPILLLLLLALLAPPVHFFFGLRSLRESQSHLLAGNLDRSASAAYRARSSFDRSQKGINFFAATIGRFLLPDLLFRATKITTSLDHLARGQADLIQAATAPDLNLARLSLAQAKVNFSLAQIELAKPRPRLPFLSPLSAQTVQSLQLASSAESLVNLAGQLFTGPKKTYLVLLQNSGELRPSGGFIEGLGFLTVESGQLLDLEFVNVYTADSQLQGQVEPPLPLKTYLNTPNWYLRDSNWDADFPAAARQAEWFVGKEFNRPLAGTLAVNLYFLRDLLQTLGPLEVPDLDQTLTAANLLERIQNSRQPDQLIEIFQSASDRITHLPFSDRVKFMSALINSLAQRQLLIAPLDPQAAALVAGERWDGGLAHPAADFLAVREANLGINQVNFFVRRNLHYRLRAFKENNLIATLLLNYDNTSPSDAWPAGAYKNYLRLYLPLGAQIQQVSVNDQSLPLTELSLSVEHARSVVGFLVTVPAREQRTVEVTYKLPFELSFDDQNRAAYSLFIAKQSGTDADPLTVNLTLPPYIQVVRTTPVREPLPGAITFLTDLATDRLFTIELAK
jgi:hypothetical protein